jgi:hypothetical protein
MNLDDQTQILYVEPISSQEYRVGHRIAQALLDCKAENSTEKTSENWIVLAGLARCQKLMYAILCEEFCLALDLNQPEVLKITPISMNVEMLGTIGNVTSLLQTMELIQLEKISTKKFKGVFTSDFDKSMRICNEVIISLL